MSIRDGLWKYVNRISGAERTILELEAMGENARFNYRRLATDKINVERMRRRHLALVITGETCPLDENALKFVGLDEEIVLVGREKTGTIKKLTNDNAELNAEYFGYFAESVCEGVNTRKVPVVVYSGGHVVYANRKFERKFGSTYNLGVKLKEDEELVAALKNGEGYEVDFKRGTLIFVGHNKKVGDVNVAHFLPGDSRMKERINAFRKKNERAVVDIYDAIRRQGVAFA